MRRAARGRSLIEIMIALVIGLIVVGAVLTTYLTAGTTGRHSNVYAQMTEDAAVALGLMRNHIAMAGYSRSKGYSSVGLTKFYEGRAIKACDDGFSDPQTEDIDALACSSGSGPDAIAVRYEADSSNSIEVSGKPTDCIGNGIDPTGAGADAYNLSDNRFFVATPAGGTAPELFCVGSGGGSAAGKLSSDPQSLMRNVEDLQLRFGVAGTESVTPSGGGSPVPVPGKRVIVYANADDLTTVDDWDRVLTVRVCIVLRSEDEVLDAATPYRNCAGTMTTPGDRRARRAFTSTIVLNNRTGF